MLQSSKNSCLKYAFFIILLLIIFNHINAQGILTGKVLDLNKEPICYANVYLANNVTKGVVSDIDGCFKIEINKIKARDTLIISYLGFENFKVSLSQINFKDTISVVLKPNLNVLQEVVLTASKSQTKEFSVKELDRVSIYMLPASYGDPLKAISFLPYSTNTSENANPELRGSSGDFSRVVLNNVPIYNPVRNSQLNGMGNFSLLNTELIAEQMVYAGNPPLTYGNCLAGLVEINTTEQLSTSNTKIVLSLANIGFLHSQKINNKSFVQAYSNFQFPDLYIPLNNKSLSNVRDFKTVDIGFNYNYKLSKHISCNLYSYAVKEDYIANSYSYNYLGEMTGNKKRNFNIFNFFYRKNNFQLSINNGTNFLKSEYNYGNIKTNQTEHQIYTSVDSRVFFKIPLMVQAGVSHDYFDDSFANTLPYYYYSVSPLDSTYSFSHDKYNHNLEYYLYSKYMFSNLIVSAGLRKNVPIDGQTDYLSYQANLRYNFKKNSVILSGGKYNGYTIPSFFIQEFSHINSSQISIEYLYSSTNFNISSSIYQKTEHTPVYFSEDGQYYDTEMDIKGAELSLDYSFSDFKLFAAYTYLNSRFNNGKGWFNTYNSLDYLLKLSVSYYNHKYINATLSYTKHPGIYYTPVSNSLFNEEAQNYQPIYDTYNSKNMPVYSTMDISVNRVFSLKTSQLVLFATLTNLLNNKNKEKPIYNNDYSSIVDYWLYQERLFYLGVQLQF